MISADLINQEILVALTIAMDDLGNLICNLIRKKLSCGFIQ